MHCVRFLLAVLSSTTAGKHSCSCKAETDVERTNPLRRAGAPYDTAKQREKAPRHS